MICLVTKGTQIIEIYDVNCFKNHIRRNMRTKKADLIITIYLSVYRWGQQTSNDKASRTFQFLDFMTVLLCTLYKSLKIN